MAKYEIEKMILNVVCQICHAVPAKVPLADLELAPGILFIPDILHCAKCGAQLTVQVREYTKAELENREKELDAAIEVAATVLAETVRDIDLGMVDGKNDVKTETEI